MSHEIVAGIRVTLSDNPRQMAETLSVVATAWTNFLDSIEQGEQPVASSFSVNETRGRTPAVGAKRGRRKGSRNAVHAPADEQMQELPV